MLPFQPKSFLKSSLRVDFFGEASIEKVLEGGFFGGTSIKKLLEAGFFLGGGGHQALALKHSFNWNGNNRPRLLQLNISPSENKKLSKNIIASSYQIYLHAAKDLFCQRTHIKVPCNIYV